MHLLPLEAGGRKLRRPIIIAGPCSAESAGQVLDTAEALHEAGVEIFRAGIWKPRTRPGSFEGMGATALQWMQQAKERTGMLTAVEVATAGHVRAALDAGIDILWIGARTTGNPFAVQEIAATIAAAGAADTTVFVKNPMHPDLELWIGALLRLEAEGITRLAAIHRGFNVYGEHLYRNRPQWSIPMELRRRYPDLPVICDPSHMGGRRDLVASISQQALDMGFDGLIVECHCCPDRALSDAAQQITPACFKQMMSALEFRDTPVPPDGLDALRKRIDKIDNELLDVIARRMEVAREIGRYKRLHKMPVVQPARYGDIVASRIAAAATLGLGPDFMNTLFSAIHEESVRQQLKS